MYLLEEIKRIMKEKNLGNAMIFVDMDGVVADYRFGEGDNIKSNKSGTYINKRPIFTTIRNLELINKEKNIELKIISSCLYQEQAIEKDIWLDKYVSFISKENRIYTIAKNFESRKQLKVDKIKNYIDSNKRTLVVLIDDTHEILFLAKKQLSDLFVPMHVITLID